MNRVLVPEVDSVSVGLLADHSGSLLLAKFLRITLLMEDRSDDFRIDARSSEHLLMISDLISRLDLSNWLCQFMLHFLIRSNHISDNPWMLNDLLIGWDFSS